MPKVAPYERLIRWVAGGTRLLVRTNSGVPVQVFEIDPITGDRKLWKEVAPADPVGVVQITRLLVSDDSQTIVYGLNRKIRSLRFADGLR